MFVMSLEALLRNGVEVTIGYGLADDEGARGTDKAKQKPAITFQAEKELASIQKRFDNFKLVFLGNTHRKLLVSDDKFAVVTSFNWLSFRGDPGKKARDEFGFLVTEPDDVESIFQDAIELLEKGYNGFAVERTTEAGTVSR
jgi:phosphatidylserine/phosphatidylglycerophosphate/cardiolipin synthase-like enzyme